MPAASEVFDTTWSVLDVAAGNCAAPAAAAPPVTGSAAVGCAWEAAATAVVGVCLVAVCRSLTSGLEAGAVAPAVDFS